MKRRYDGLWSLLRVLIVCVLAGCFLSAVTTMAQEADVKLTAEMLRRGLQYGDPNQSIERLNALLQRQNDGIRAMVAQDALRERLKQQILDEITPEMRMRAFQKAMRERMAEGMTREDLSQALKTLGKPAAPMDVGTISGTVTVNGGTAPLENGVWVDVYDVYGYYIDDAWVDDTDGSYTVYDLPPGDYFVTTNSNFVDEFYDDIMLNGFGNWRQVVDGGHLVTVTSGNDTPGIDFDLLSGARISGTIYEEDGVTPITYDFLDYEVFNALDPFDSYTDWVSTDENGNYEIYVAYIGGIKLHAQVEGFMGQFYNNKDDWETADVITLATYQDDITGIDFLLADEPFVVPLGGAISGTVTAGDVFPLPAFLGFGVAFSAEDTTIAGLGAIMFGTYTIGGLLEGLSPGDYFVYVDDIRPDVPLTLLGLPAQGGNFVGEFYDDAVTIETATPVTVALNDTTRDINFQLASGGGISGTVTGPTATGLDSIVVVAFHADLMQDEYFPFPSDVWMDLVFTDADGNYLMSGLPSGEYIVRTIPILSKHAGMVMGEYYQDVHNLFAFGDAQPVSVWAPGVTPDIDFALEAPGIIAGTITGSGPIEDVTVVALDAATGIPAVTLPGTTDETGAYMIPGLEEGDYKVLAVPPVADDPYLLPEFYDGMRDFDAATVVPVAWGTPSAGIDFTLETGGFIQGFVNLPPAFPLGADTLWAIPVAAYDSETGKVAGTALVTFSGGYRIGQLPAGMYYVAAIPTVPGLAVTYFGGGDTYDDLTTTPIIVVAGDSVRADITLEPGLGSISGRVEMTMTGTPILSFVMSYDQTGHMTSYTLSGFDMMTGMPLEHAGDYTIFGLRPGAHFVRTWSLFGLLSLLMGFEDMEIDLELPKPAQEIDRGIEIPRDAWYSGVPIDPASDWDIWNILFILMTYQGLQLESDPLTPFYSEVDRSATPVNVTGPSTTTDIDFYLRDVLSDVEEEVVMIPESFGLDQNFPNPFNPETTIRYHLPVDANIELSIYNLLGRKMVTLKTGPQTAGTYEVIWNGLNERSEQVPSGVYVFQLKAGEFIQTRKLALIR